jgi:hypothetical protein
MSHAASEVTPVLKALRANGLNLVAIHNLMTSGEPTVYFLRAPDRRKNLPQVQSRPQRTWGSPQRPLAEIGPPTLQREVPQSLLVDFLKPGMERGLVDSVVGCRASITSRV